MVTGFLVMVVVAFDGSMLQFQKVECEERYDQTRKHLNVCSSNMVERQYSYSKKNITFERSCIETNEHKNTFKRILTIHLNINIDVRI